jgi:flavin-dependent dehydrogenase
MRYDVAVIGGGLAGCSAAIRLAQQGLQVILCEASDYPRHKVCGEFMSPGCQAQFEALGVAADVQSQGAASITSTLISTPDGTCWQAELPGSAVGISRYYLDARLVDEARHLGVDVRINTPVTDISGSLTDKNADDNTGEAGFTLQTRQRETIQAQAVIGAHGKRSTVDRVLDRPFMKSQHPFVGLKQHMRNLPVQNRVELHTFPGGYCGISHIEDGLTNVCLLVRLDAFQAHGGGDVAQFIGWMQSQNPLLAQRLRDARPVLDDWLSIARVPFVSRQVVTNQILMAGDAAGMITPLTGDGMEIALQSGELVARHLTAYFREHHRADRLFSGYRQAWHETFQKRVRLGRISQFFMLRPAWLRPGLKLFQVLPGVGEYFIRHTRQAG